VTTKQGGPPITATRPNAKTPATRSKPIVQPAGDVSAQLRRRREAADRLPPLEDGRRDPLDPDTRHRCVECKRDVRLRPFKRLLDGRLVCRRCFADRWTAQ
jgi:hypothetical protein